MIVLLDESGDLGFSFGKPFREGGSSRYLTLAVAFVPRALKKSPRKLITGLYKKYKWQSEKKASEASLSQKLDFCALAANLLEAHPEIKVDCITVRKEKVEDHLRQDPNTLYNYMVGLVVPDYVGGYEKIIFTPDERSIKVRSGNSLADFLQVKLWYDHKFKTTIENRPSLSHYSYNLQFVDWIAHCVWVMYEDGAHEPFEVINKHIKLRKLFF